MLTSENSDDEGGSVSSGTSLSVASAASSSSGVGESTVLVVDGVTKTVRRRLRKRNVPMRDFAQSP